MASSYKDLKANKKALQDKLAKKLEATTKKGFVQEDPYKNYWRLTRDKAGNGNAIIRFLAAPPNEDEEFVLKLSYNFQIEDRYYIENSRRTLGENDPMHQFNQLDYETEEGAALIKQQKRGVSKNYISNIYVVKDPANPENNGKVFLFRYGASILEKLKAVQEEREELNEEGEMVAKPIFNPFCMDEGANFMLKAKVDQSKGQVTYEDSQFGSNKPLFTLPDGTSDDEKAEQVWNQCFSLQGEIHESKFRPYSYLYKRVCKVMGLPSLPESVVEFKDEDTPSTKPEKVATKVAPKTVAKTIQDEDEEDYSETPETPSQEGEAEDWMSDLKQEFEKEFGEEADDTPF